MAPNPASCLVLIASKCRREISGELDALAPTSSPGPHFAAQALLARKAPDLQIARSKHSIHTTTIIMDADKRNKCNRKAICISVLVLLLVGGVVGFVAFWFTRPENIEVTAAQADEQSPLTLVQASENGNVRIDSSYLLTDPSNTTYYLTIANSTLLLLGDQSLYLVPNLAAVDFDAMGDKFVLQNVKSLEFPVRLPPSFDPSLFEGGVFATPAADFVVHDTFDWIIDMTSTASATNTTAADDNDSKDNSTISVMMEEESTNTTATTAAGDESQGSSTAPTTTEQVSTNTTSASTEDESKSTSTVPTTPKEASTNVAIVAGNGGGKGNSTTSTVTPGSPTDSPTTETPTMPPTVNPTKPPTKSPTNRPTESPTKMPTTEEAEALIVLFSELSGGGYGVAGTITLQYRTDLDDNGNVVNVPFLLFENINAPSAPGPFLWMTRRANDRHRQILDEDVYIAFEDRPDGSFTKGGTYAVDFPQPEVDFSEFVGGSFIVWCEPFSVWIGGGDIVELQT